jgi:hypothetical protein
MLLQREGAGMQAFATIITTIQEPTASVHALAERIKQENGSLLVIGDKKGPARFEEPAAELFSLQDQLKLPFSLAPLLPVSHYARKNLGYLVAFSQKAPLIYETDDDNAPKSNWHIRTMKTAAQKVGARPWANVYRFFTEELIWPRGFPLNLVNDRKTYAHDVSLPLESVEAPIQQGLADLSPDVDAAWRLLFDREFAFPASQHSVWLPPGTWCPFNSQSTWWWPAAYPLMYLPSFCSFRMTDIWRSFIAQRCLWELGKGLVFHPADVIQERNVHNLMLDFEQEIPGYLHNEAIIRVLADLPLAKGIDSVAANLLRCYKALAAQSFINAEELPLVRAWVRDFEFIKS